MRTIETKTTPRCICVTHPLMDLIGGFSLGEFYVCPGCKRVLFKTPDFSFYTESPKERKAK